MRHEPLLSWLEIFWPAPLLPAQAVWLLRRLASDHVLAPVVFETVATGGRVRYLVGIETHKVAALAVFLTSQIDHLVTKPLTGPQLSLVRGRITSAAAVRFRSAELPLDTSATVNVSRGVLAGLAATRALEGLALQVVLWCGLAPQTAAPGRTGASTAAWWADALRGVIGLEPKTPGNDHALEASAANKAGQHGFVATVRIGVTAETGGRREHLALGLLGALGTAVTPGVRLDWRHVPSRQFSQPLTTAWLRPRRDQSRLSAGEIPGLAGLPVSDQEMDLPGLPPVHPRLLPLPIERQKRSDESSVRVFAVCDAPATLGQPIGFATRDNLTHLSITAPTGSGKSTLLWHLINGDMAGGGSVVVIDPKGDLVQAVLSTMPKNREPDVVVLDPTERDQPVGFNPLQITRRGPNDTDSPELVTEAALAVLSQLWQDTGIQTGDILHMSLLTLATLNAAQVAAGEANTGTLVDIPRLLSDQRWREQVLVRIGGSHQWRDGLVSGFWAEFAGSSQAQQARLIEPVMRRMRQLLSRRTLRRLLGQPEPRFSIGDVFASRGGTGRILLVPLNKAALGEQTAQLFGSLVVARLWNETLRRASPPTGYRQPVSVIIDEAPDLIRLPLSLDAALAQARGYGVGFTLVSQFHSQWPTDMQGAIEANTLSKICFRLPAADAKAMSVMSGGQVAAEDFMSLQQFHIYASLARDGHPGDWFSGQTLPPPPASSRPERIRRLSRERYGQEPPDTETDLGSPGMDTASPSSEEESNQPVGRKRRQT